MTAARHDGRLTNWESVMYSGSTDECTSLLRRPQSVFLPRQIYMPQWHNEQKFEDEAQRIRKVKLTKLDVLPIHIVQSMYHINYTASSRTCLVVMTLGRKGM